MNILLDLSYDGTNFCGFQVQKNGVSVCETVQNALEALFGARPDVKGCGRTDAGVHALHYALNFWAETSIPVEKLPLALNRHLPDTVRVNEARQVPQEFHARYSAHTKTYVYRIWNSPVESPFEAAYHHRVSAPLNAETMDKAAAKFVGKHDFLSLCSAGSSVAAKGDTVRTISACKVERQGPLSPSPSPLTATFTIWCASWPAPWWRPAGAPLTPTPCPPSWPGATAALPGPPCRQRVCF